MSTTAPVGPSRSPGEHPGPPPLAELIPLLGAVAFAGPPVALIAVPWLLLVFLLIGPFALLLTAVVACVLAVLLVALLAAIAVTPYLLVRRLKPFRLPTTGRIPSWSPRSFSSMAPSPSRRAGTA
jgi:hypothetical protein